MKFECSEEDKDKNNSFLHLKDLVIQELKKNKVLVEKGKDQNSSSGSDDCPSEDNISKKVLKEILFKNHKKDKDLLKKSAHRERKNRDPTSFQTSPDNPQKKKIENLPNSPDLLKQKEEKKTTAKPEIKKIESLSKIPKKLPPLPLSPPMEDQKEKQGGTGELTIVLVDAATQTEKIYFEKARYANLIKSAFYI